MVVVVVKMKAIIVVSLISEGLEITLFIYLSAYYSVKYPCKFIINTTCIPTCNLREMISNVCMERKREREREIKRVCGGG